MANNPKSKMKEAVSTYNYLKFSSLSETQFWDYYTLINRQLVKSKFPLVKLSDVLVHRKGFITIDDNSVYKRCRAQIQGKGIVLRDEIIGKEIKTKKQQLCKSEDFLVAEIDAKVGGYGIIPPSLEGAIVSGHYFLFEIIKDKLLPDYLGLVVKQNGFSKQVKSTGSTNYAAIRPYHVLEYQIPLPSLADQERLIDAYNNKVELANGLQKKVNELEDEIQKYFLEQLGIEKSEKKETKTGLQIFEFSNIDRWDVWVNKSVGSIGTFKPIPFRSIIIGKPIYGANVKGVKTKSETRYIRITDINENGSLNDEFVSPEFVEEKYLLKENDFLIARSGNTVGKTFLFKEKYGRAIYAGYLVKYNIDYTKVIPEYLFEYTKSFTFKNWVASNQRIAGQPNINGQEYLEAPFIIPPMPIQIEIIKRITEKKEAIQEIRIQMDSIRDEAQIEFEKEIFSWL